MMKESNDSSKTAPLALRASLWIAQFVVFAVFVMAGFMKLTTPIPDLAKMIAWAGQLPTPFVRTMGLIDLAGGIGIVLPALTRIRPRVGVWAALGCTVLQVCAIVFHTVRGEAQLTPLNYILLALSLFVLWGRSKKVPIAARPAATA